MNEPAATDPTLPDPINASDPVNASDATNSSDFAHSSDPSHSDDLSGLSYPRLKARTRGFQLGRPRSFTISGDRVLFIRSQGATDPVGCLWQIDPGTGIERLLIDPLTLGSSDDTDLPDAERARRERMREVTSGITAYSVSQDGSLITFAVNGNGYVFNTTTSITVTIPAPSAIVDPRIAPDGSAVAYVCDGSLMLWPLTGTCVLLQAAEPNLTWGLADFVAAEELERHRGFWWLRDSSALLVERVDESAVDIAWISDPEHPQQPPRAHRYPMAGTNNADISLWRVERDGVATQLAWPQAFEYLATVSINRHGVLVQLLTRDQRRQLVMRLDGHSLFPIGERTDQHWVDVIAGVPALSDDGSLLDIINDTTVDAYRLTHAGIAVSEPHVQVTGLLQETAEHWLISAQLEPTHEILIRINRSTLQHEILTDLDALTGGIARDDVLVTVSSHLDQMGPGIQVKQGSNTHFVESLAAMPNVAAAASIIEAGSRNLRAAVLLPSNHIAGTRLPVICSPYGGPHHARVVRAAAAYATEQWIADQGFAVVIADGRGTPGRGPAWDRAISRDVAGPVLQDQVDAVTAAAEAFPDLDLSRVGIRGWSFGGYLAALAVLDRPDVFHAAVAGAPVTDWHWYDTGYTERYLGLPDEDPAAYERVDLIRRAPDLTRPLMILHGLADDNVLVAHALGLSSALLAAGREHALIPLSGVSHMTPQEIVAENLLRLEVGFFQRELS